MDLSLQGILLVTPVVLFSLSIHECAHAWTARRFGDRTAEDLGRITLNPMAHIDLLGLLMMFLCGFGWAKPVPYDRGNLQAAHPRHVRWTELAVAAAGPLSNLLAAGVMRLLLLAASPFRGPALSIFQEMMYLGVIINVGLCLFNLIPIHPLDGFTVLRNALPLDLARLFQRTQAAGMFLLLGLVLLSRSGGFSLVGPARDFLVRHVYFLG